MTTKEIIEDISYMPDYFNCLLSEIFKNDIDELENKMVEEVLKAIKDFPKSKKGYIKNRLKVEIKPIIIFKQ